MKYANRRENDYIEHDNSKFHDVDDDDVDVDDDADNDDLYWYEVVVVSSFLKCLKNQTALLRHKRLVWSLREAKVEKCYSCWQS